MAYNPDALVLRRGTADSGLVLPVWQRGDRISDTPLACWGCGRTGYILADGTAGAWCGGCGGAGPIEEG